MASKYTYSSPTSNFAKSRYDRYKLLLEEETSYTQLSPTNRTKYFIKFSKMYGAWEDLDKIYSADDALGYDYIIEVCSKQFSECND